jgi:hypothetical protein
MDIHLSSVAETELAALLPDRGRYGTHMLTDDPASADLILLIGSFGLAPALLLDHPLYRACPEKCAVYTEDYNYLPLVPGVYCSAIVDESSGAGRTASFSYVSARGIYLNPYVKQADAQRNTLHLHGQQHVDAPQAPLQSGLQTSGPPPAGKDYRKRGAATQAAFFCAQPDTWDAEGASHQIAVPDE